MMAGNSLLRKAKEVRSNSDQEGSAAPEFVFDEKSGISREDQQEILKHIDTVAKANKILSGPEIWKVRPRRRGVAVPLMVNLVGALVLVGGLFGLGQLFPDQGTQVESETVLLASAEGRLLQEIKREAEGRILEKDREIATIQERMAAIDNERASLLAGIETRIKAKETELRAQLDQELERERQRLIAEGLSEEIIQERLKAFEQEKLAAFQLELDTYARQAEAERLAIQANLDSAKAQFQKELSDLSTERQRILNESREREQALRQQLDERNQALEAERARTAETIQTAQAQLARLNEDLAKAKAAEDQLLGLYSSIRQALREGRIDDAARNLSSLRNYLADPGVVNLATLRTRREADLFAVDLIERAVLAEQAKAAVDTSGISEALDLIALIKSSTERARAALATGDRAAAATAYQSALSANRELQEASTFVDAETRTALAAAIARANVAELRIDATKASIAALDTGLRAGNLEQTRTSFVALLTGNETTETSAVQTWNRLLERAGLAAVAARQRADSTAATGLLEAANAELQAERYLAAIQEYTNLLVRYPLAEQAPQAVENLRLAGRSLAEQLQAARENNRERIENLSARLEENQAKSEATQAQLEAAQTQLEENRVEIARLTELANRPGTSGTGTSGSTVPPASAVAVTESQEYQDLAAEKNRIEAEKNTIVDEMTRIEADKNTLEAEKSRIETELSVARAQLSTIESAYGAYAADEDRILATGDEMALVQGRSRMDAFLGDPVVSAFMPDLRDRIATYLAAYELAGQSEVLYNAADIVDSAARIRDTATRDRYYQDLENRYAGNENMLDFLAVVRDSLR
jgi:chromosome segregation ATPase